MLLTPDPIQVKAIDYCVAHPYAICALDMGLGKTLVALAAWERTGGALLVVCPAYLCTNWKAEIEKCFGRKYLVAAFQKGSQIFELFDTDICIISYDLAQKAEHLFEWADMVVADEIHELKSMNAKRTQFFHKAIFENSTKRLIGLTGTPIPNRVAEFYSLLCLMNYSPTTGDEKFLERFPDEICFADHFSHRRQFQVEKWMNGISKWVTVVKWTGIKNTHELKRYLKNKYIRIKADETIPLRIKPVLISEVADPKIFEAYEKFNEDHTSVASDVKAMAALEKVPFTVKYVKGIIDEIGCVPIYTDHVDSCEALALALGVPAITGKMPSSRRAALVADFQAGRSNYLVATIGALSLGVTLVRSNNLVVNDFCWVPGKLDQVYFRIKRKGQTKACVVHHILGSPQDKAILASLGEKSAATRIATD